MSAALALGWAYLAVAAYFAVLPIIRNEAPLRRYDRVRDGFADVAALVVSGLLWLPFRLWVLVHHRPGCAKLVRANLARSVASFLTLATLGLAAPSILGGL